MSWCTVAGMPELLPPKDTPHQTTSQAPKAPMRLAAEATEQELRYHPRVRLRAPFACSFERRGLTRWWRGEASGLGIVFNVSMTGAKVLGETELKAGDRVTMNLRLPKQSSAMTVKEARVRWVRDHMCGLEFTRLSPAEEWRLWKFMELLAKSSRRKPK
ncbi:MAG: PilZ domain-containing protein [Nitrospiraceae bacterium]